MARSAVCGLPASLRGMLEELASADAAADQRWILVLLQEHGPGVVAILWGMLGREQDVLDAYQNVACHLLSRGPNGVGRNRGAYFYRSAINAGIELIRRQQRDRNALGRLAERSVASGSVAEDGASLEPVRMIEQVRAAVVALPPYLRDVILLRDMAGFNYARVAKMLNITAATARVYRRQAIVRLAVKLSKEEAR